MHAISGVVAPQPQGSFVWKKHPNRIQCSTRRNEIAFPGAGASPFRVTDFPYDWAHLPTMEASLELNHTIIPARDKEASARFFAKIMGLGYDGPQGHSPPSS